MNSALLPFRKWLQNRLDNDENLKSPLSTGRSITGVLSYVPENQPFPYIYLDQFYQRPDHTFSGGEARIITGTITVWTDHPSDIELLEIEDRLTSLLEYATGTQDGWKIIGIELQSTNLIRPAYRADHDDSYRGLALVFETRVERV